MKWDKSARMFAEAKKLMPGGVNSPVRAFGAVGGDPLFIAKASGSKVWDEDGNSYTDYVASWGPAILGHAQPEVVAEVQRAAARGLSFGAPTRMETQLAQVLQEAVPALERLRLVSSGTEACMTAIRLARGYTGREKIIKFEGNYHGHADLLLVKGGSGLATLGLPGSAGVPAQVVADTLVAPYNDLEAVSTLFKHFPSEIAGVIVEPLAGNAGFIRALPGFLEGLQELCKKHGALFIVDEVMTGFRVAYGGVQTLLGLKPDLTTFGKVIGGGMPLAAYGGRAEVMRHMAPEGAVYQAGTLSGNPLATVCGLKTLELLKAPGVFKQLGETTRSLAMGLQERAAKAGIPLSADSEGGMFGFFFSPKTVRNFAEAQQSDVSLYPKYFKEMLKRGVYLAPSAYEAGFVSVAHSREDIAETLVAAEQVFAILRS